MVVKSVAQAIEQRNKPPPAVVCPQADNSESIAQAIESLITGLPATEVHFGTEPPENPVHGDLWYHSDENRLYVYVVE